MKNLKCAIIAITIMCLLGQQLTAQVNCVDQVKTTTPTSALWDWTTTNWEVKYRNALGGQEHLTDLLSPFHNTQNDNTSPLADPLSKDNKPEDGWELISKNMGMGLSQGDAVASLPSAPYVLLYNKNTARLRIYLLVVQLFSEIANNDPNSGGRIKVFFGNDRAYPYQSNLLTTNVSPMLPLDKFTRDLNIITPNTFRNTLPYWLYADIPVAYDPCTCLNKGKIRIEASLNSSAQVNLDIIGVPRSSPIDNGQTNVNSDFLTGFSAVGTNINGGLKAAATVAGTVAEFKKGLGRGGLLTAAQLANINADISEFEAVADQGTALLKLIPQYGEAISSIVSFVDYFVSGGKSSGGETPSGVVIMNDFKATGTISSASAKNIVSILIPGSNSQGFDNSLIPKYNNTLGVFNLLRTPKILKNSYGTDVIVPVYGNPGTDIREHYEDIQLKLLPNSLNEAISYVVNPAVYPDLELSDIKVAIQVAGIERVVGAIGNSLNNMITETKTTVTYPNGITDTTDLYRTEYYPIGQIGEVTARLNCKTSTYGTTLGPYGIPFVFGVTYAFNPIVTLKVVARIKRKNTTKPEEDIIFIATYPVDIVNGTINIPLGYAGNPDLSDMVWRGSSDMIRGFNGRYGYPHLDVIAKRNIVLENGRIFAGVGGTNFGPYPLSILTQAYSITMTNNNPNDELVIETTAGDIVFEAKNTAYQAPVSPANVFAFCDTTYKDNSRNTASAKTVEAQAETPKDVPVASPKSTQLLSIYPNPTTGEATITYEVDKEGSSVAIYLSNNLGIRVMEVSNEVSQAQGTHNVRIDTRSLAAGMYFYTLILNGVAHTERLVVIK